MKSTSRFARGAAASSRRRPANPPAARLTHTEELQLAYRRDACRREILALLLHTPSCLQELRQVQAELSSGKRATEDVMELSPYSPEQAADVFAEWVERAQRLQARAADAWAQPATTQAQLDQGRELACSLTLATDTLAGLLGGWLGESSAPAPSMSGLPPVLQRQVRGLLRELQQIRERFLAANQGMVHHIVQGYQNMGMNREDLIQEANIGMLRGIEKFDPRRGGRFCTYAVWWIRQGVRRALANQARMIRLPVHTVASRYALDRAIRRVVAQLGREPTPGELAHATGMRPQAVARLLDVPAEPLSLDAPQRPDTDLLTRDTLIDLKAENGLERVLNQQRLMQVQRLLETLTAREREMVGLRFGLDGAEAQNYEEIGARFAITRERVRQIVAGALQKLHRNNCVEESALSETPAAERSHASRPSQNATP